MSFSGRCVAKLPAYLYIPEPQTTGYSCYILMSQGLKKVGNYRLVRKIGSGATSEVFQGRKEGEIERFAIKMIKVKSMSKEQRQMIAKEVVIIKSIDHPHIVKLHDTLETPNNYYLVFQFCERGDLEKYLKENIENLLPPDNVRKIIKCIGEALRHLHARGIAHRDIKLANVLLKKDFTIKLADFGFAREAGGEEVMMQTYCGTPITMAPEILQGRPYDKKCDIWSMGVILFQLVFGRLPFPIDKGYVVFINKVTTERVKLPTSPSIADSLAELLFACLERDQIKRYSIEEFLDCQWMKESSVQQPASEKNESVSEVLKRVSREGSKHSQVKEKEAIEKERVELQRLERLLAGRIYDVLCVELGKMMARHVSLRSELSKLVEEVKELRQVLWYYDAEMLRHMRKKYIKLRLQGDKDVFLPVSSIAKLAIPEPLQESAEPCQAGAVIMNYLKKQSISQQFDNERKKLRYEIVMKLMDFIQNFEMELVLIFTNGYESDITLERVANHLENCSKTKSQSQDEEEDHEYCPALNQITIALECREKQQKFREYANALKASCQKRLDAIQREINGY